METKSNLFDYIRGKADQTPVGLYYNLNLIPSLEEYNRADTVNMTPNEMNKFRHIAGTKQSINDLGVRGLSYSLGKELYDVFHDGIKDTLFDLKNDMRALKMHIKKPDLEEKQLYDYVFQNYIKPYRQ